jgi:hypothetical protein
MPTTLRADFRRLILQGEADLLAQAELRARWLDVDKSVVENLDNQSSTHAHVNSRRARGGAVPEIDPETGLNKP